MQNLFEIHLKNFKICLKPLVQLPTKPCGTRPAQFSGSQKYLHFKVGCPHGFGEEQEILVILMSRNSTMEKWVLREFALEMIHRASLSHRNDAKNIHGKAGAACGISGFSFCISQLRNPLKAWTNFPQSPIKCHSRRNRNNFFCREWTDIKTRMQN